MDLILSPVLETCNMTTELYYKKVLSWWNQFTVEKKRELASMHGYDYEDMWEIEIASLYHIIKREEKL